MRLLVLSMVHPNALQPHYGAFVRERLRLYLARHGGEATVVAPVPRAPPLGPERWTRWRDVPAEEDCGDVKVLHPRFWSPPGFGDRWRAALFAEGIGAALLEAARTVEPDVLDVHFAYPDGAAAVRLLPRLRALLGRRLPLVLTCRGTDLNLMPGVSGVREQIVEALAGADHVVCVAEALRRVALDLGSAPERTTTLRNGVDLARFTPGDRGAARAALRLPSGRRVLLCVGHLVERKGQHLLLEAVAQAGGAPLLVCVGDGEARQPLEQRARELGLDARFVGAVAPAELPPWYRAADALVLASEREGWPNVVLEALACGTPVLATRVWGTPEILEGCAAGRLVEPGVAGLAAGLRDLDALEASAARPWAERFGWEPTLDGLHAIFTRLAARAATGAR